MSYCRKDGKDDIIFITKDDFETRDKVETKSSSASSNPLMPSGGDDEPEAVGLIKENGEINWECPCLQGMGKGPCGEEFKDAFACFHYSESEPKGVDCLEQFKGMQECFVKNPEIYGSLDDDLEEEQQKEIESENVVEEVPENLVTESENVVEEVSENLVTESENVVEEVPENLVTESESGVIVNTNNTEASEVSEQLENASIQEEKC